MTEQPSPINDHQKPQDATEAAQKARAEFDRSQGEILREVLNEFSLSWPKDLTAGWPDDPENPLLLELAERLFGDPPRLSHAAFRRICQTISEAQRTLSQPSQTDSQATDVPQTPYSPQIARSETVRTPPTSSQALGLPKATDRSDAIDPTQANDPRNSRYSARTADSAAKSEAWPLQGPVVHSEESAGGLPQTGGARSASDHHPGFRSGDPVNNTSYPSDPSGAAPMVQPNYPYNPQQGPQPVGPQPVGPQPVGPQPVGPQAVGPQPLTPQPLGPRPLGPQPVGGNPAGPQPVGPQPIGPRPVGPQPVGPRPVYPGQPTPTQGVPPGGSQPTPKVRAKTAEEEEEEADIAEEAVRKAPPWLVSAVVHMVVILILALIFFFPQAEPEFALESEWAPVEGEQLEDENFTLDVEVPEELTEVALNDPQPVPDPVAAPPELPISPLGTLSTSAISTPTIGAALDGRSPGMQAYLRKKYGGNPQSERAVQLALAWLAKQQHPEQGYWRLDGPYSDGIETNAANQNAATAMALLAFQGNGHTHKSGKYKNVVAKGWEYLLQEQQDNGDFFGGDAPFHHHMYTHGQCMIAVCELYGMTKDPKFKVAAEKAVQFAVQSQDRLGGWRYTPGSDSDTSVTGWILMGLQSARMARLEVPEQVLDKVGRYLDKAGSGPYYGYQRGHDRSQVMTAEGLLCRQYLGWEQDDPQLLEGADWLLDSHMPKWGNRNPYYWYYATQMFHHLEGNRWERWNKSMRDLLVEKQRKTGAEAGSWDPNPENPHRGGRLFVTCLCTYCLEVYYRHLPIYSGIKL